VGIDLLRNGSYFGDAIVYFPAELLYVIRAQTQRACILGLVLVVQDLQTAAEKIQKI